MWKTLPYPNHTYEISDQGILRKAGTNEIKNYTLSEKGYYHVSLNGRSFPVHRLVVSVFSGEIPEGLVVNHKDGNKQNNSIENLEVITLNENFRLANRKKHEQNPSLSAEDIRFIYTEANKGVWGVQKLLAEKFNLDPVTISNIKTGKLYRNITESLDEGFDASKYKLSPTTVTEIYQLLLDYPEEYGLASSLSEKYGVSRTQISHIATGKSWGWLTKHLKPSSESEKAFQINQIKEEYLQGVDTLLVSLAQKYEMSIENLRLLLEFEE